VSDEGIVGRSTTTCRYVRESRAVGGRSLRETVDAVPDGNCDHTVTLPSHAVSRGP